MTPALHMSAREFKRLARNVTPNGMGKGDLMHLYLLIVEARLQRRITPDELRSARFVDGRKAFVELMLGWKPKKEDE